MDYKARLQRARTALVEKRLDALVVTHLPNIRYLCGFRGSAGLLILHGRNCTFFTDGRYTEQAHQEVRAATIRILKGKSTLAAATEWLDRQASRRRIGIDGLHLTIAERSV